MGQITTTQNLVAIKEVRHAGQLTSKKTSKPALLVLLGERQEAQILKFNAPPLHT